MEHKLNNPNPLHVDVLSGSCKCVYLKMPDDLTGWKDYQSDRSTLWIKGYVHTPNYLESIFDMARVAKRDQFASCIEKLDGHFAFILKSEALTLASTDRVSTVPLYYRLNDDSIEISPTTKGIPHALNLESVDRSSALSIAMSGHTIGSNTLHKEIQILRGGQFLIARNNKFSIIQYHSFQPWEIDLSLDFGEWQDKCTEMMSGVFEKTIRTATDNGQRIAVALSAGSDSRLIASGLAELGAKDVVCYSYGPPDSYEAMAAEKISKHLGYEWRFAPYKTSEQRKFWRSKMFRDFLNHHDPLYTIPAVNDIRAISILKSSGFLDDCTVINGRGGDFLTGRYLPRSVYSDSDDPQVLLQNMLSTIVQKFFRLWRNLATEENDRIIENMLCGELGKIELPEISESNIHGVHEYLVLHNRHSKFTTGQQRIYEYFGLNWQLPLWDREFVEFWQRVPSSFKLDQYLYKSTLMENNWGNVWQGEKWQFRHYPSPKWMRYVVRPFFELLYLPFSADRWPLFETRYLSYWSEQLQGLCMQPYLDVIRDKRGFRNSVSWQADAYLRSKGIHF